MTESDPSDPFDDLPHDTFDAVTAITADLVRACAAKDAIAIDTLVQPVYAAHGDGGRFAVALALAIAIEQGLGLGERRQQLVPGQRALGEITIPWDVILYGADGYDLRVAAAALFLSGYLSNREPHLWAMFRASDETANNDTLRGLCEITAALQNPPPSPETSSGPSPESSPESSR